MDIAAELENPKSWFSTQILKSKLVGQPLYFEILTRSFGVLKLVVFEGEVLNLLSLASVFSKVGRRRSRRLVINYSLRDAKWERTFSTDKKELIDQLVRIGILEPVLFTHPIYKVKNTKIVAFTDGPKCAQIAQFLLNLPEVDLLYEEDIIKTPDPEN